MKDRNACLLGNRGMICRAGNLKAAVEPAQRLEIMCGQYLLARQLPSGGFASVAVRSQLPPPVMRSYSMV